MPCCTRRSGKADDGIVDGAEIRNAIQGRPARLTPAEARIAIWRLASVNRWGPGKIGDHLGYSKSQVASVLADIRSKGTAS